MDVIHAEEVEIARERARVVVRGLSSMRGGTGSTTTTTSSSSGSNIIADQVMMIHGGFRFVEEIERLNVRRNRLATLRASITHENLKSALCATERAILAQFKLELLSSTATTDHHLQEEAAAAAAAAPEIEGLKRLSITKQRSNSNNNCGGRQQAEILLDVCAICHEEWKIGDDVRSVVGCSHAYHYNCISKWIKRNPTCPMCRYEIPNNTNNNKRRRRTL